jgi:hypothetical protein
MKKTFFWLFLITLSFNNKHLFAVEKSALNEVLNDSILKTENVSKLLESTDFLFTENSKNYFNILLRNGFLTGPFQNNEFVYKDYSSPTPEEINVDFQALIPTKMGPDTYLLYPGGGMLFKFNESSGAIKRIDRSFAHRNQYSGYFFSHNKNLYLLGGYGFWETKSLLTKFNFSSGEWDYIPTKGQAPEGIDRGVFLIKDDKLYAAGFVSRNSNNQKENREDNLYVLTLPTSTSLGEKIAMKTFNWEKKGILNPLILNAPITALNNKWIYNDNLLIRIEDDPNIYLINPIENTIKTIPNDLLLYKSGGKSIIKNNEIISTVKNSVTGSVSMAYFDINGIENNPDISEEYLYRSSDSFYDFLIFGAILLASILIFLWAFFNYSNKNYILINNEIVHSKGVLKLSEIEINLITLFIDKKSLANSKIMSLFTETTKTKDYAVKRKNRTLTNLNQRFSELYGTSLLYNQKSKTDSRQTNYFLNQKINLKRN